MPNDAKNDQLIRDGIAHIKREQLPDGGFQSLSSPLRDNFSGGVPYVTTFFTSTVLSCLAACEESYASQTLTIRERAATFLIGEKGESGSFNYWSRTEPERNIKPYPDDLDDTFAALAALAQYDHSLIDGTTFASTVKILTTAEAEEGGPYRTWLIGSEAAPVWRDIDVVVNSTVHYFLSLVGVHLPKLEQFLADAIRTRQLVSPYYPSAIHSAYFVARSYRGEEVGRLGNWLVEQMADGNLTTLERAMVITSLINLGLASNISPHIVDAFLIDLEKEGWRAHAFCIDPSRDGKKYYAGSSALTAAFCVEALSKYAGTRLARKDTAKADVRPVPSATAEKNLQIHKRTLAAARAACAALGPELKELQQTALAQIEKMTDEKITTLAHEFKKMLRGRADVVSESVVKRLSLANLYGWMAYTIYDDFLDEEGEPTLLPSANFFLRQLSDLYQGLDKEIPGAWNLFNDTMNIVDGANGWEQAHCRVPIAKMEQNGMPRDLPSFGDYHNLADRSIGHALGPLTELLVIGYAPDSKEFEQVLTFFRHYLIARQLHDDAHDWAQDLARGQINSVGALVLHAFVKKPDGETNILADLIPRLQVLFWKEIIDDVVQTIRSHIAAARTTREASEVLRDTAFLEQTLATLERAAQRTIQERDKTLAFLEAYKS